MTFFEFIVKCFFYIGYFANRGTSYTKEDQFFGTHGTIGSLLFAVPLVIWFIHYWFFTERDVYSTKSPVPIFIISTVLMLLYFIIVYVVTFL